MNWTSVLENPTVYRISQKLLMSRGHRKIEDFLRDNLRVAPTAKVLDLGCGSMPHFDANTCDYTGIDLNPDYVAYNARTRPGTFIAMDATELEFRDATFDAVFSVGLCHHLSEDQIRRGFHEWLRVLKPGGQLLVVDAIMPLQRWNVPGWILRKLDRGDHVLPWPEWRSLFASLAPVAPRFAVFGSYPYDFSSMSLRKPPIAPHGD